MKAGARHAAGCRGDAGAAVSVALSRVARVALETCPAMRGARVLVGCSGGADSMALVLVLDELRRAGLLDVVVAHVHHGLRDVDADADAAAVASACTALALPF